MAKKKTKKNKGKKTYKFYAVWDHCSGRYDRADTVFNRGWAYVQRKFLGDSLESGTEASGRPASSFSLPKGWGLARSGAGIKDSNAHQFWLAYNTKVWRHIGESTPVISNKDYHRAGGMHVTSQYCFRVILEHRESRRIFIFYVQHMSLDHTKARAAVWFDECDGLHDLLTHDAEIYKGVFQVIQGDINKNWRNTHERGLCKKHLANPLNMTCCWDGHLPKKGGTHGSSAVIDHTYVRGGLTVVAAALVRLTALLRKSSDHHPYRVKVGWN